MMKKINEVAAQLLKSEEVSVIIGYGEGSNGNVRPLFARNKEETEKLIYDNRCTQNLATYIYRKEIVRLGKPAIIANLSTLRGIIRLAAEKQIKDGDVTALFINESGVLIQYDTLNDIEKYLSDITPELKSEDKELIEKLETMNPSERWVFWTKEMENCMKCYACRQACPLCYCTQCSVEVNQPQWIPVASNTLSNLEWHIMRAMHLSGRCIECGQCGEACPVNIPIHLLPIKLAKDIKNIYGTVSGINREEGNSMATYKPDDKEEFIK